MDEQRNAPESAPTADELRDLAPREAADQADGSDAEVKGGRKAGGGQQDYLIVKMDNPIITG